MVRRNGVGPGASSSGGKGGSVPLVALIPLRIFLGYWFLKAGLSKLGPWITTNALRGELAQWAQTNPYPFWRSLLTGKAAIYSELISHIITYGEIVIGTCLIVGLLTRAVSILAGGGLLIYLAAAGYSTPVIDTCLALVTLWTVAFTGAGRSLGLDSRLFSRAPVMPFTLLY